MHRPGFPMTDFLMTKMRPTFFPTGPYVVPREFVPDYRQLRITLKVNGEVMQDEGVDDIIYGVEALVAYASRVVELQAGDLLLTGSPAGNAAHHGNRWLVPGDVMEGSITGLGVQRNRCVAPGLHAVTRRRILEPESGFGIARRDACPRSCCPSWRTSRSPARSPRSPCAGSSDVLGLEQTTQEGQSAYLRGWGEWLHSSLIVTEGPAPALAHIGWRTYGPDDVDTIAQRIDPELAEGWVDDSVGHGRSFRFRAPMGHVNEVFWETELYEAPPELQTDMRLRPQRYTGRGAAARYIDHVTINAPALKDEIAWYRNTLGFRHTGSICPEPGVPMFSTLTTTAIRSTHDLALVPDAPYGRGRVNHVAFRVDQRLDVERAADVFLGADTADRVRTRHPRHGRDHLPVRARAGRAADRDQLGRLAERHARLGAAGAPSRTRARRRTSATCSCPTR